MKEKVARVSVAVNIFLAVIKVTAGLISGSSAVLAEGVHSFMDVFTSVISFLGIRISQKPSDKKHPYGHYKIEVFAGGVITLILLATGLGIIYESYQGFIKPEEIKTDKFAFLVMLISALTNELMARMKISTGKKENSISLLSDGFHSRVDFYASLVVLIGLFFTRFWVYTDSLMAFLIGIYIIKESFSLGKEATDSLLDASASEEIEAKINSIIQAQKIELSSLKTQKKGSVVTANIEIKLPNSLTVEEATKISENLRKKLMEQISNLVYVAIQVKSHAVSTGFYKPFLGRSFGWQRRGKFKRKIREATGRGPGGNCICPKCGYKTPHYRGKPCSTLVCPNCKINLERD